MRGPTGTPVLKREVEERSRGSGPVIKYNLTPRQLEIYRETGQIVKEEETMSLTRDEYLKLRYQGKGRTEIMKEHYKSNTQAFYRQLQEWGIKEKDAEERELDLMAARKASIEPDAPAAEQPADEQTRTPILIDDEAESETPSSLAKQLEQLILQHTQPQKESLTSKIKRWATERNLHSANPDKQMLKLGEEFGELCRSLAVRDMAQVIDAIGDMYVVLTVLSLQLGLDVEECIERAYEEIKDRKGRIVNGVFVKEANIVG